MTFLYCLKRICEKILSGWYDAAFRLGLETHQILFVNIKRTRRQRAQSPVCEFKVSAVWPSIAERFPIARSRVTIYSMKIVELQRDVGWRERGHRVKLHVINITMPSPNIAVNVTRAYKSHI